MTPEMKPISKSPAQKSAISEPRFAKPYFPGLLLTGEQDI